MGECPRQVNSLPTRSFLGQESRWRRELLLPRGYSLSSQLSTAGARLRASQLSMMNWSLIVAMVQQVGAPRRSLGRESLVTQR